MEHRQTHFFYALKLPAETKSQLNKYCQQLQGELPFLRWVHGEDYHITLAFLGDAPVEKLELSKQFIQEQLSDDAEFSLTIQSLGTFGRKDSPRIFWAGVEQEPRLDAVRAAVFSACTQAGFQLESRPFHPHITLARKWKGEAPFPLTAEQLRLSFAEPIHFLAKEVVLYQTHLDKVPKYEAIATFRLS
ncbi:RNA 2',3'-cyclic phosphodiesterase [Bacillus sp. DNRA2]|uniref:RNA 2',3'-cyclic phosphodiesterase n=1 Tax=Bacillus sp. DNRA2 TaxID=2723053 RepID=UPI00145DFC95|nr:RNA 2',3'-cyclic phosphodiesterase [Bacillus sp. DNRA2]NMD72738.1 RNA 2',3'-cyclic phosphodiesterase [Bacillus sp. DNRA2]